MEFQNTMFEPPAPGKFLGGHLTPLIQRFPRPWSNWISRL